jgi:hypothetical protein
MAILEKNNLSLRLGGDGGGKLTKKSGSSDEKNKGL